MADNREFYEERISFADIYSKFVRLFEHLISIWKRIILVSILIFLLYSSYQLLRSPVYTANSTFVLESSEGDVSQLSSLASSVGINVGGLLDGNTLFQTENIVELYRSQTMLYDVFMSTQEIDGISERLITRFGRRTKQDRRWTRKVAENFTFEVPDDAITRAHDSIVFEVIRDFKEKNLLVKKPDRRLSILAVRVNSKDEKFAKRFNEILVKNVNDFYLDTKTRKTGEIVATLQKQVDSVKMILDEKLVELALATERVPNPNPLMQTSKVPIQKLQIDTQTSAAVYTEMVKNLELAKISHLKNTPLVQLIDKPRFPLEDNKDSTFKTVVLGGIWGGFLSVIFFTFSYLFSRALGRKD